MINTIKNIKLHENWKRAKQKLIDTVKQFQRSEVNKEECDKSFRQERKARKVYENNKVGGFEPVEQK